MHGLLQFALLFTVLSMIGAVVFTYGYSNEVSYRYIIPLLIIDVHVAYISSPLYIQCILDSAHVDTCFNSYLNYIYIVSPLSSTALLLS